MWRFIFITFLIAHGGGPRRDVGPRSEAGARKEAPFDASYSWLLGNQRPLAATVAAAIAVVLVMAVYFTPWFIFIEGVNAARSRRSFG